MRYIFPENFEEITEALSDEEAGRLLRAMLAYINRGETITLNGAERVLFPQMRKDIDTFIKKSTELSKTRSASGKLGGLAKSGKAKQTLSNSSKSKQKLANASKCFTPPTPEEVEAYCNENGFWVDANQFCDYYKSNGWKVGSAPMKDWRATVRNWNRREQEKRRVDNGQKSTAQRLIERIEAGEFDD